jgi:hypothetical protein
VRCRQVVILKRRARQGSTPCGDSIHGGSSENLGQNFALDYLRIAFDEIEEASLDPRERLLVRGGRSVATL